MRKTSLDTKGSGAAATESATVQGRAVSAASPAAQHAFSMPAEWRAHDATWIVWPHNASDWPGKFASIRWAYADIVRYLTRAERVSILVSSTEVLADARGTLAATGCGLEAVDFHLIPNDRSWIRDYGPIFVDRPHGRGLTALRFGFNGWALYPEHALDAEATAKVAREAGLEPIDVLTDQGLFVLEGGAIDVDGLGTLVTTEQCLLDQQVQVRNPGFDRDAVEAVLRRYLGATKVIWLGDGLAGDETHGHVDDLCRFVGERTVVACRERRGADPNHRALEENLERLQSATDAAGSKLEIIELPMPAPIGLGGEQLPASYANFYCANHHVLVPTFNDPNDYRAVGILSEVFAEHTVVGIHSLDLLAGGGTIHCSTHQQPKPRR